MNLKKVFTEIKKDKVKYSLILIILLFAFFLRIYFLGNSTLWIDETISANGAREILEKGLPVYDSGNYIGRAVMFHYIQAFSLSIFNNDFGARLPSVLFGMATIILAFFFSREYFKNRYSGIITILVFSVFYLEVFYSRQARMYQMFQFMFFLTLYFLYKSRIDKKYLLFSIISFIITLDTHLAGLVLAPFIILVNLTFQRKYWYYSIIPIISIIQKFSVASSLSENVEKFNYLFSYLRYGSSYIYLGVIAVFGVVISLKKNKFLTGIILIPSLVLLIRVFNLEVFAFRYSYFFIFPILIYFSLSLEYVQEKLDRRFLIILLAILILIPSNLFFSYSYANIIKPEKVNLADPSAPVVDYKNIPESLKIEIINSEIPKVIYFSPSFEWYIEKPDFVIPFSLDGIGNDSISVINASEKLVDVYSGSEIVNEMYGEYYFIYSNFEYSKLKEFQRDIHDKIEINCLSKYEQKGLKILFCSNPVNLEKVKVKKVIDGDTIELENEDRVRLICINSPEIGEAGYLEAKKYLSNIENRTVYLEKDISEEDKYGRKLRYVYFNGKFINKELVKENYAKVFRYSPDTSRCDEIEKV